MIAPMKAPQVKTCPLIMKVPPVGPPPPTSPISGVRKELVNEPTNAVNAAPMTTATASSTTLPRSRKSLNPFMPYSFPERPSVRIPMARYGGRSVAVRRLDAAAAASRPAVS